MLMIRSMVEGKEGRLMRNEITARMWEDCETRLKLMTHMTQSVRRKGLEDLLQQFRASLIAYDEGFLTDDKTLSAALWRTLFTYESVDPKYLELIVQYIRTQVEHLHTIGTEKFFLDGKITWKPFPPFYP
ncbi:unnamed protein product [Medioppia subpectinata]|uniref:Ubiquinol-cytochrome c chaperone domain-containing protein n=1 Tax=Medioppia subpectinata TaxID=1979941 RepID=A0A7R9Q438_9ACAR|nr:unnamed protein product [Medioppia subpectinata]CAG2112162.1 unnamed protein product [Medioppia subpectinata]